MSESLFFEFFGAKGHAPEAKSVAMEGHFAAFKAKHNRKYSNEKEEAWRKHHFHHNFRFVCANKDIIIMLALTVAFSTNSL